MVYGYNRPYAHPVGSFVSPVVPPDVEPAEDDKIQVCVSVAWLPYVMGALSQLTLQSTWKSDDPNVILLAQQRATYVIDQFNYQPPCGDVQAPYWDEESGDDADDTASEIDQTWYGQWDGETFLETLAYVFLTNFLSTLVSPLAAVRFLTIPRTFRVAIKQNPHGAKVLLFLNGGLYAVINGYSIVDQVFETIVHVLPSEGFRAEADEPVELMLVNSGEHDPDATPDEDGNYTVGVIRMRLTENDVKPANQRYNPTTDTVQITPDGGETWNDAEGSDPRRAPAYRKPPRTGSDRRCDAAANMVAWVKGFMDEVIADLEGIGTAGLLVSTALDFWSLLFEPLAIVDLIAAVASTIGGLGSSVLDAAFDTTTYDLMLCIFLCGCDADGQVSADGLAVIQGKIATDLNATAAIVMALILGAQGEVGLSNAGAIGTATGDCADCEGCGWCKRFDEFHGLGDWEALHWTTESALPTYSGGAWHSAISAGSGHSVSYIHIRKVLDTPVLISDGGILNLLNSCTGGGQGIWVNGDGSIFSGTQVWAQGGSWSFSGLVSSIEIQVFCVDTGDPDISFNGLQFSNPTGDNPFGESNC